jgi:predicted patatin/cPLA2 family phospholipase
MMSFLQSDFGQAVSGTLDTLVSGMSSIFQQLTTIVQAELQIQTAGIEKKYDREISLAEGNNYKVKKLEKQGHALIIAPEHHLDITTYTKDASVLQGLYDTAVKEYADYREKLLAFCEDHLATCANK